MLRLVGFGDTEVALLGMDLLPHGHSRKYSERQSFFQRAKKKERRSIMYFRYPSPSF